MAYGGKSGGPVYYESRYGDTTVKTVVAITSAANQYSNNKVWGTRMTPTLLKFYLNNDNI